MEKEKIDRRKIGTAYEQEAVLFLKQKGYRIIARNYYCKQGEIDIIAVDQNYLVFVEVKYRSKKKSTSALEAVTLSRVTFRKTGVPCSKLTDSSILLQYTGMFSISYPFGSLEILYAGFQFKSTTNGRSTPIISMSYK